MILFISTGDTPIRVVHGLINSLYKLPSVFLFRNSFNLVTMKPDVKFKYTTAWRSMANSSRYQRIQWTQSRWWLIMKLYNLDKVFGDCIVSCCNLLACVLTVGRTNCMLMWCRKHTLFPAMRPSRGFQRMSIWSPWFFMMGGWCVGQRHSCHWPFFYGHP